MLNKIIYIALVAAFGMLFGNLDKLIKRIRDNRKYKKACKQIGWTPQFDWTTLIKN